MCLTPFFNLEFLEKRFELQLGNIQVIPELLCISTRVWMLHPQTPVEINQNHHETPEFLLNQLEKREKTCLKCMRIYSQMLVVGVWE